MEGALTGETGGGRHIVRACKRCRLIIDEQTLEEDNMRCPNCKSTDLSSDFSGILIIIDPEKSEIAAKLGVNRPGQYALRVR